MKINKTDIVYLVNENLNSWVLSSTIGNVSISHTIKKSECPSFEELVKFVMNSDIF